MSWSTVLVKSIILHLKGKLTFLSFNSFLYPFDPSDNKVIRTSKEGEAEALPKIKTGISIKRGSLNIRIYYSSLCAIGFLLVTFSEELIYLDTSC
jgi:hypothetical protein